MPTIYFDYNATTPLDAAARAAMEPYFGEVFGNPSSIHQIGRAARAALDEARDRAARLLRCKPSEAVFTSGGTESNNLALFGVARMLRSGGRHMVVSPVEHHSVLHAAQYLERREGWRITWLPVDREGRVNPLDVEAALEPGTALVSVMAANNETGAIQPVAEIGRVCRRKKVLFHTDASQWFGKEPFEAVAQFEADLVTLCAHKFHGPRGAGLLYIRSPLLPDPLIMGGGHENERRAGTENLPAIAGMVEAMERFIAPPVFPAALRDLTQGLMERAEAIEGVRFQGPRDQRLANTVSFTVEGCDSIALLAGLDIEGVCASSGSACSAGSLEPSHVLRAMGLPKELANSYVRFSLGRESTAQEVSTAAAALRRVVERIRN